MIARCQRRPLAVLVDEAHTLDLDVGNILLNASQHVRVRAPFLLVLAGTPGLLGHLGKMNATFWDRLGRGLLGIGRLSDSAAREALEKPLAGQGASIDADALDDVVEQSQCYAYFIRLWGEALWDQRLATGETRITAKHAAAAQSAVQVRTTEYYQRRYRELEAADLLPAATAVAPLFDAGMDATATDQNINAVLGAPGLPAGERLAVREAPNGLGYIWCPPGQLPPAAWSAGIPSLMQYVLDQGAPSATVGGRAVGFASIGVFAPVSRRFVQALLALEGGVVAAQGHEFGVVAGLRDAAVVHHHDARGVADGGEAVRDDEADAALQHELETLLGDEISTKWAL